LPSWIKFNSYNNTLYGIANQSGTFNIDVYYKDDGGMITFTNVRLTVTPKIIPYYPMRNMYLVTYSFFGGIAVYFTYMI
jgi:6-phosphogluconolactonase (cycloisomerase 2 family)